MSFTKLLNTIRDYSHEIDDLQTVNVLVNSAFKGWIASKGIGQVVVLESGKIIMNINGQFNPEASQISFRGITNYNNFISVDIEQFTSPEEVSEAIEKILKSYFSEGDGAYVWIVPDGYMASLTKEEKEWEVGGGGYFSHESICVSNTSDFDTVCTIEVLYEDADHQNTSCEFEVGGHRSVHYRLDKLKAENNDPLIAKDQPTSYKITSLSAKVVVQGSRILTSGDHSEFASFGTVIAWTPQP
ncbi:uncharacterized protein METZ01_LOCUS209993 [marine metagenome]|uniref:Uncharacterized protein n=1 Tax=marine metagenome TaxID=408172 RepID=A0A382F368_9ZZZZ